MIPAGLTARTSALERPSRLLLRRVGTYEERDATPNPPSSIIQLAKVMGAAGAEGNIEPRLMREELQQLSQSLEARASEKTAELIAGEGRVEMPHEDEPQQSRLAENATAQSEIGDFDRLLTIIQGYTTIMKSDLDDAAKLKEDIEAISEAASLVQALINSHWAQRLA